MPYPQYDPRDDVTDAVMKQRGASTFDYGLAGLPQQAQVPMTGPTLPGLPQTPAGGVPGAGIGPAGPSTVALPPQMRGGGQISNADMMAARRMPPLGGMGGGQVSNADMMAAQRAAAQRPALPVEIGSGQISNADMMAAQRAAARRPRGY